MQKVSINQETKFQIAKLLAGHIKSYRVVRDSGSDGMPEIVTTTDMSQSALDDLANNRKGIFLVLTSKQHRSTESLKALMLWVECNLRVKSVMFLNGLTNMKNHYRLNSASNMLQISAGLHQE